jgi:hypothetical protein
LIDSTPTGSKRKAANLLREIEAYPNELTFDSFGRIIIEGIGIPGSNIFVIFPMLFKNKKQEQLIGFKELLNKLNEMGLSHFFNSQKGKGKEKQKQANSSAISFDPQSNAKDQPWYYIGP